MAGKENLWGCRGKLERGAGQGKQDPFFFSFFFFKGEGVIFLLSFFLVSFFSFLFSFSIDFVSCLFYRALSEA